MSTPTRSKNNLMHCKYLLTRSKRKGEKKGKKKKIDINSFTETTSN